MSRLPQPNGDRGSLQPPVPMWEAWEQHAEAWLAWARTPGHDAFWRITAPAVLAMTPAPGRLTLDVGCGEGRLSRELARLGHRVISLDAAPTLVRAARDADDAIPVIRADAAALPVSSGVADLVVA